MLSTSSSSGSIIVDTDVPDGVLNGFSADGVLIVSMRYIPTVEWLYGAEGDEHKVVSWRTSRADVRRIAAITAWNSTPHLPCQGNA